MTYPVLLFDGVCNLCNGAVQFVIKNDPEGHIKFAALQSQTGQKILKEAGMDARHFTSLVWVEEGKISTKSTAALHVARYLKWWRWASIFFIVPRPLRDIVYDVIARNRYRLWGKKESCMLPTAELKSRFLE